ncbi:MULTISPECIES: CaiB/BaiF CoA transferase family protein [unclassified Nocardioides]|uniref:CaiB/BaiF CoA transferase family protein n=1 Tax=unclassified Nocardioides TaxID=2615069 RepID=UPI0009F0DAA6|nr:MULTISPECIES: CaiB/BaiF CoA-transferase family protein [unclassified Nocardioides]GAW50215.1 L-carnitine dehydratase/bile acid-inducible protein F [Nocardioides sp. PD653-B2]GAW53136.1 L-carnitine dehydratase/bile acid-inducible protein F [Nocardioides sp. PD653]
MSIELGQGTGPLRGVKVVEIAGIGPGPHACMILADLGADVIRVERPGGQALAGGTTMVLNRGRPSVALDLKNPDAVRTVLELVKTADVVIEGMRPGVTERLGLGPDDCRAVNERIVYGRMTGWGQDGPLAQAAGHDMNYIAITGALHMMGQDKRRPHFPANLVGDFGGGSTYLVIGILAALLEAKVSGRGQVVDAAIVDGTAHLNAMSAAFLASGGYREERASNLLDGGVPFYDVYETSDGKHLSVGSLEPQFFATLVTLLGVEDTCPGQGDLDRYDEMRQLFTDTFASRTQAEWIEVFEGTDACVAGILPLSEAFEHPHMAAREIFVEHEGLTQPAPAPRFSRTRSTLGLPPPAPGTHTREALTAWGVEGVDDLIASGAAVQA